MWDEITCPIPNFNGYTFEPVGMDKLYHSTLHNWCDYLSMPSKIVYGTLWHPSLVSVIWWSALWDQHIVTKTTCPPFRRDPGILNPLIKFAYPMAISMPCTVQDVKTIRKLRNRLWYLRNLSLSCFGKGGVLHITIQPPNQTPCWKFLVNYQIYFTGINSVVRTLVWYRLLRRTLNKKYKMTKRDNVHFVSTGIITTRDKTDFDTRRNCRNLFLYGLLCWAYILPFTMESI